MATGKRLTKIQDNLKNSETATVLLALAELKQKGDINSIKSLLDLISTTKDELVYAEALNILQTIKIKDCEEVIVDLLSTGNYQEDLKEILSAFWQAGLDGSNHVTFFVETAIKSKEYEVCFECLTILENVQNNPHEEEIITCITQIQDALNMRHQHEILLANIKDVLTGYLID